VITILRERTMTYLPEVKLMQDGYRWLVSLDGTVVGRFDILGDALAYANLLECDPRTRSEATPAA
jgi:hypothetical protein